MIAFNRSSLGARLDGLSKQGIAAFMAACVQRHRLAAQALNDCGRDTDVATFNAILENLWVLAAGTVDLSSSSWDGLDGFGELELDEEAHGVLAYSEDAIVALWYATQFVRTGELDFALHCASRCRDSAGFLDDFIDGDFGFAESETRIQLWDLLEIESGPVDPELIAKLKLRSDLEAGRIGGQLPKLVGISVMNAPPILKSELTRIEVLREAFVGARIDSIRYQNTLNGGLAGTPTGDVHEVELGVEIHLSTGAFLVTWEREHLIEGIVIYPSQTLSPPEDVALASVDEGSYWQDYIGDVVCGLNFMWQISELGCPESLWAVRLTLASGKDVVVALGELDIDSLPRYHPDSLVVIFDEVVSRSYSHPGAIGTAWSEAVNEPG